MRSSLSAACVLGLTLYSAGGQAAIVNFRPPTTLPRETPAAISFHPVVVPPSAVSPTLMLIADAEHQRVASAQLRLRSLGIYGGTTNGTLGPQTRSALSDYQRRVNLPVTGQLDERTAYALDHNELLQICMGRGLTATECLGAIEQFYAAFPAHREDPAAGAESGIAQQACDGAAALSECENAVAKMNAWFNASSTLQK